MNRFLLAAGLILALCSPVLAQGIPNSATVVNACGAPPAAYTPGQNKPLLQDQNGNGCITVNSSALPAGSATASNQTNVQSAPGTPQTTAVTVQGNASGVAVPVSQATAANLNASVVLTPTATVGVTTQSCTVACASTIVSGAHALYSISGSATVTGTIFLYDAVACAANGTVTPKKAFVYGTANAAFSFTWTLPIINGTGLAVCFSSTGPYTATASTTAFLSIDFK